MQGKQDVFRSLEWSIDHALVETKKKCNSKNDVTPKTSEAYQIDLNLAISGETVLSLDYTKLNNKCRFIRVSEAAVFTKLAKVNSKNHSELC